MKNYFLLLIKKLFGIDDENALNYMCGREALPTPLSGDEERDLVLKMSENLDYAKNKLIEHNLRLVVYIAKKFENTGIDLDDLISVGTIGLIKAVNSFDGDKKIKLATYASRCIENEILMYLRKSVKLKYEVSLDEPLNVDWEGNELLLSDVLGSDNDVVYKDLESSVEHELLWSLLKKLNNRDLEIVKMRFGLMGNDEKTQKEVADIMGISQSYISRIEKKIISKLKKEIIKLV